MFRDERLIGVGFAILQINDSCGNHLYQRKAFAQRGNPFIRFVVGRIGHDQIVAAFTGIEGKIDFFLSARGSKNLAFDIG